MTIIKNAEELKKLAEKTKNELKVDASKIQIKIAIALAHCGWIKKYLVSDRRSNQEEGIKDAVITQTGCMGYCYGEPTVEVTLPGKKPVVFSDVDATKAKKIVFTYVKSGQEVDGTLNNDYDKRFIHKGKKYEKTIKNRSKKLRDY